jgi:hypothetical protein
MKHTTAVIALLFSFLIGFTQKKFEGTIIYTVHDNDGKGDHELTALFGRSGIKFKFREGNDYDKDVIVINLDSGIVYTLNEAEKTFTAKYLKIKQPQQKQDLSSKTIAGYNTKPIDVASNMGNLAYLAGTGGTFILYRSDSLFYPIPDKYLINPELVIINNNNIVLGATINMGMSFAMDPVEDSTNNESKNVMTIMANEIKWQSVDEKEFQVSSDYKKLSYNDYPADTTALVDSAIIIQDSTLKESAKPVQKVTPKQNSKPKAKTKTTSTKDIHKPD